MVLTSSHRHQCHNHRRLSCYYRRIHMRCFLHLKQSPTVKQLTPEQNPKRETTLLHANTNTNTNTNYYSSALQGCTNIKSLKQLHASILVSGLDQDVLLGSKLVNMYAKYGSLEDARLVFDKMQRGNVFLWNAMIRGYTENGVCRESITLYYKMQREGIHPDNFTFSFVLKACAELSALQEGKDIHCRIVGTGIEPDAFVEAGLVDMYVKCGRIEDARHVFDKMSQRNVVSWTTMIGGYAQNRHANEALIFFNQMQLADVKPNPVTIVSVLSACAHLEALQQGRGIHAYIIRSGFESNFFVETALLDMYSKCGNTHGAHQVFHKMSRRDVVSWSAMITAYAQNGRAKEALTLFNQMRLEDVKPNPVTLLSVLSACANLRALQQGQWIHEYIIRSGFESDYSVMNSVITMYAKCGRLDLARHSFDKMSKRNVISWNAMIAGYEQNAHANDALALFHQMQLADVTPDSVTMVSVLSACAHLGALQRGKWIHNYIIRSGFVSNVFLGSALIDMYAKCGYIEIARQVFDKMCKRNVVLWTAMLAAYGMHGHGEDALALFSQMRQMGLKPNHITFISVLSACSHAGLVDEAWQYFDSMSGDYCIIPSVKHYACMVDLLGRAGHLDEAQKFIKNMPLKPDAGVWGALLGACRIHCNLELGEHVAKSLFDLEPEDAGYYILLSNIYAAAHRWDDVERVRTLMKNRGLKKTPGCSLIEVNSRIHEFLVGDRSHPQSEEIYAMLETLGWQLKAAGYVPNVNFVLNDVEEEGNAFFAATARSNRQSAIKFISKIVRQEIIVRDATVFHHFKHGLQSCGDYYG